MADDQAQLTFTITLYWSEERGSYLAEVPNLPGCQAQGESYEQALANVQQEIEARLAAKKPSVAQPSAEVAPCAESTPSKRAGLSLEEAVKDMKKKGKL